MDPQYGSQPASGGSPYGFIMEPSKAPKRAIGGLPGGSETNNFIVKLALLIGGAVILIVVIAIGVNLFFGNRTNLEDLVQITETQQELIRVSSQNGQATDQGVLNAAVSTKLSMTTQQQSMVAYLKKHKRVVKDKELSLKKDVATDKLLRQAQATSTFDSTFTQVMRRQLTDYANSLKTSYKNAVSKSEKALLSAEYDQTKLLLKQWPAQ